MARPDDDYRRKRDFARTPEPEGGAARPGPADARPVFVIHRHDARNLHYDLRLEVRGSLASWAIPRGFSYDPKERRLAVRTEDHPIEYEHFEGVIPDGEYGAGTMRIWDRGTFRCVDAAGKPADPSASIAAGELKVVLDGRRVRGEWHLVKTKQSEQSWLMFKSRDRYAATDTLRGVDMDLRDAAPGPLPSRFRTRQTKDAEPFSDASYAFEAEFDGRPVFATVDHGTVRWHGIGRTRLPDLDLAGIRGDVAALEGTLVALDPNGRPSRDALEVALRDGRTDEVQFYVHDLLHFEGLDLRTLPLIDRKAALAKVLPTSTRSLFVDHVLGDGEQLATSVAQAGLRAIRARRKDGDYRTADVLRIQVTPLASSDAASIDAALRPDAASDRTPAITNPGKIYWPDEGLTKSDLCAYYAQVSDALLPHLADRPVHLHRFPDGIEGESFYQHKPGEGAPDWLHVETIDDGEQIVCDDLRHLVYLGNLGSIDLHPWMSRLGSLDHPDWVVIDLDPKDAPFADVVTIARATGELLREIGLRPLLKTSGKTGLHVYVPLVPVYTYDQARMFAEATARVIAKRHRDIATVERNVSKRGARVYVDFGQNRRGQTVVAPYVVRPVPGATVSTPLAWDELDDLDPRAFTLKSVPARVRERGDLFRGVLDDPQELLPAIDALQRAAR